MIAPPVTVALPLATLTVMVVFSFVLSHAPALKVSLSCVGPAAISGVVALPILLLEPNLRHLSPPYPAAIVQPANFPVKVPVAIFPLHPPEFPPVYPAAPVNVSKFSENTCAFTVAVIATTANKE